jgi:hypothetical protein
MQGNVFDDMHSAKLNNLLPHVCYNNAFHKIVSVPFLYVVLTYAIKLYALYYMYVTLIPTCFCEYMYVYDTLLLYVITCTYAFLERHVHC